jgi:ABC-type antimicrobial peptide transport system permease subunit
MALGLIGAVASARVLTSLLFGLAPLDAPTFMDVPLLFLVVVVCAAYLPARRAARLDPLTALRHE